MANFLQTPEPHYIPGYTGYCPQYMYRTGDTYASATHKILLDPKIHKSDKLVLSDRTVSDFQPVREETDLPQLKTQSELRNANSPFQTPIVPGYTGKVPGSGSIGKTYSADVNEAKQKFYDHKLHENSGYESNKINELGTDGPNVIGERPRYENIENLTLLPENDQSKGYSLPLLEVRPEYNNVLRNIVIPEPAPALSTYSTPMDQMMQDLGGPARSAQVPFGHAKYGQTSKKYETGVPNDFTTNYRLRLSTEWAPVNVVKAEPPLIISSADIYHKHLGMVPNYTGHIPGQAFRSGRTYGTDTRDAKRWIRGDHTD